MTIRILNRGNGMLKLYSERINNCTSININDPSLTLMPKKLIYAKLFNISNIDGLPNISYKSLNSNSTNNCKLLDEIHNYKPNIYIGHTTDEILDFINYTPDVIILTGGFNCSIIYNRNDICPQFSDLDENDINHIIRTYTGSSSNGVSMKCNNTSDVENKFQFFRNFAVQNIVNRLIIEFIMQYRDNPTISATKKDNKTELLEIINNMQNQIDELKRRIDDM